MSLINRYIFIKNNKYYCIKEDKDIFKICKNNISEVRKNKINYLIIDNLVVIESHFYKDNNYNKYKMLIIVMKVLEMVYDYVFNKKQKFFLKNLGAFKFDRYNYICKIIDKKVIIF